MREWSGTLLLCGAIRFEEQVQGGAGDMKRNVPCLIKDAFWSVDSWAESAADQEKQARSQRGQQDAGQLADGQSSIFKGSYWGEGKNIEMLSVV